LQLDERYPGLRALVEDLLRRRHTIGGIIRQIKDRCGVRLSHTSVRDFWKVFVVPQERAEADALCGARAQVKALLEEVKADPKLDATKIVELLLTNQIVRDRLKLGETDIMALYREQREREKLELQRRALSLREKEVKKTVAATSWRDKLAATPQAGGTQQASEALRQIREIYGLSEPPEASNPARQPSSPTRTKRGRKYSDECSVTSDESGANPCCSFAAVGDGSGPGARG
jgi:hypothetical protein